MSPLHPRIAPMRLLLPLLLAVPGLALAQRPVTYEEALRAALVSNPAVVAAGLSERQADADVTTSLGQFDPVFAVSGGWNRTQRTDVRQEFSTLFITRNEGWTAETSLSATSPTGTTARLSAGLTRAITNTRFEAFGDPDVDPSQLFSRQTARTWIPVFRLSLGQELLRGVLTSFNLQNVRAARERASVAQLEAARVRQQAVADVARAYWNWVYVARLSDIAEQSVAVAEENLRVGAAKVEQGRAPQVEQTRLEAARVQAWASALEAKNNAAQAADALLILVGEPPGQEVVPATGIGDVPIPRLDAERVVAVALEQAPEVRLARERLVDARRVLRDARHALLPSLSANVDAQYSGAIPQGMGEDLGFGDLVLPSVTVGGALSVPLGNRAAVGQVRRAEAEVARQDRAVHDTAAQVTANVRQQVRVLEAAAQRVALADANVRLARETLAAEEALYDVGRGLLRDVLSARTELERAQGEAMRARTDFRVAEVELLRLQGALTGGW